MITKTDLTLTEVVESLTGFDEKYIREQYELDIEDLLEQHSRDGMRALAIVLTTREGASQDDAYQHVMGLTLKQLDAFFAEDEPEAMPDEPETESGKGDSDADK